MVEELEQLIAHTKRYRDHCRRNNLGIDAAACSIRLVALEEALKIFLKYKNNN